jgi:hypothetical protein
MKFTTYWPAPDGTRWTAEAFRPGQELTLNVDGHRFPATLIDAEVVPDGTGATLTIATLETP